MSYLFLHTIVELQTAVGTVRRNDNCVRRKERHTPQPSMLPLDFLPFFICVRQPANESQTDQDREKELLVHSHSHFSETPNSMSSAPSTASDIAS